MLDSDTSSQRSLVMLGPLLSFHLELGVKQLSVHASIILLYAIMIQNLVICTFMINSVYPFCEFYLSPSLSDQQDFSLT